MSNAICRNCQQPLPGKADFCPGCGQSVKAISRAWYEVVSELFKELVDLDGRMLVSLRLLLTRPGHLSYEYTRGRRRSYTSPIRMYLVISLVFFFVLPMIMFEPFAKDTAHKLAVDEYSKAMFLLLPAFALVLNVFFRQTFYLSNLVFVLYLCSALFVVFALMLSMEVAADRYLLVIVLQIVLLIYLVTYFIVALQVHYRESWLRSILKFIALFLIYAAMIALMIDFASYINSVL